MAYKKINETRHCVGRLRTAIWLKYKNTFTIKKIHFQPIMNSSPKFFRADSIPNMVIKRSSKVYSVSPRVHFVRLWLHGADLVGCASLAPTIRLRLPDAGARKAQDLYYSADIDILLKPRGWGGRSSGSNSLQRGEVHRLAMETH